jgi:hypothetical protein
MRAKLAKLYEAHGATKHHFRAIVGKDNPKFGWEYSVVLQLRLVESGKCLADHVWAKSKKSRPFAHIRPGDMVEFVAEVYPYERTMTDTDYGLRNVGYVHRVTGAAKQKGSLSPLHPLTLSAYGAIISSVGGQSPEA